MNKFMLLLISLLCYSTSCNGPLKDTTERLDETDEIETDLSEEEPPTKPRLWEVPEYAYAKIYIYNLNNNPSVKIITNNKLNSSVVKESEVKLDKQAAGRWKHSLMSVGSELAECFEPHHALVFYDSLDQPVASASICMMCKQALTFPGRELKAINTYWFESRLEALKLPVFKHLNEVEEYRKMLGQSYQGKQDTF